MNYREMLKQIVTRQKPLIDVWHYLVGNYRYKLYYSSCKGTSCIKLSKHWLMRQHIWEQIVYRINNMNKICYQNGSCIKCSCDTTQLQMANKRCDGICYPTMMNKKDWKIFKSGGVIMDYKADGVWIAMSSIDGKGVRLPKHIFYKETNTGYVPINNN